MNEENEQNYYDEPNENEYYPDNSYNENRVQQNVNAGQMIPKNNRRNPGENFAKGFKNKVENGLNNNNLARGFNKNKNSNIDKPENKDGKKENPSKGQKDEPKRKNPLPGGTNKKDKKNLPNNPNEKNNKEEKKDIGQNKSNVKNQNLKDKLGLGKKKDANSAKEAISNSAKQAAKQGVKAIWLAIPIPAKVVIIVSIVVLPIFLLLGTILLIILTGGIASAATVAMCGEGTSGSSYNGEGYTGENDSKAFACAMQHPTAYEGIVTSKAGARWGRTHNGVDIGISTGSNIYASQAGVVVTASAQGSYGNLVEIKHTDKITTKYAHNSKILVNVGDKVGKGQLIAKSGSTGRSTGPHLHFEITYNGRAQPALENAYFINHESFKKNCGSSWDGELAGDSAKQANDTTGVTNFSSSSSDSFSEQCCDTSYSSSSSGDYCPNGIVVEGVGTLNLDDYVAGVVSAENAYKNSKNPDNIEAMKAQAIAARTYAVNSTDNCTKKIGNSQASQVYTSPSKRAKQAATETAGSVMTYKGKVFSAQYDAFCMNDSDCPDASCSGTTCSVSYTKVPSNNKHKITVKTPHSANVYNGEYNGAGHARGMSQLVARQMQDEGKKFDEILKFFYADGIFISGVSNQCTLGRGSFEGNIWYFDQTDYEEPYGSYGTISSHGCGPTAMAIAVSSLLNEQHDPVELTNFACSNNFCTSSGTKHSFFEKAGEKYELKVKRVSKDKSDEIFTALNGGDSIVIAIMGAGTFTSDEHFITLTGSNGDKVFVHDPNNGDGKKINKLWDFSLIKKEASGNSPFWIISK